MANTRQATKRIRVNYDARLRNQTVKSDMRSAIKNVETAVHEKNVDAAKEALPQAVSKIDKAVQKGIIHKNNGDRKKSTLMTKIEQIAK
ncbi:30S ribosomal protein S20 [Tenuibacillus multivorans]|uniref:Small ribosomal subunit protein bS20 n=1 Tax=Tenuibacillus multivorans TaxID=237069 RepID=A0A1G9ZFK5_9BACI|nr:30S ribosomal protein S20 [Tenuibacillus multivorans]GEL78337.1 30S ribosomal protein S20 [Tenuibacillus multivorans]SDN19877.1 small subunit ribosomal protein S20 [Tenuibacillus multivorans]